MSQHVCLMCPGTCGCYHRQRARFADWLAEPSQRYRATQELLNQLAVRDIERSLRLGRLIVLDS